MKFSNPRKTVCIKFFATLAVLVLGLARPSAAAVRLILDTDASPDFDDIGALAIMHTLADSGEAEILATVACNRTPLCVPVIEIVNAHYGRAALPVGCVRPGGVAIDDKMHVRKWPEALAEKYATDIRHATSAAAPDAVGVYRRALVAAPDGSVTICAIGFFTNLADLLSSPADDLSPLDGRTLVARKVKALYAMAGYARGGREFNVYKDAASARAVFSDWPTRIVVSPAELGNRIRTGTRVAQLSAERSPVRDAFAVSLEQADKNGRQSWDETTVYAAVRGGQDLFARTRGTFAVVDDHGNNTWTDDPNGPHELLSLAVSPAQAARTLEDLMVRPPAGNGEIAGRKMAWAHYVPWYKPENASLAAGDFYNFPLTHVDERESRGVCDRKEIELAMANGIDGWLVDLGANPPKSRMNSSWDMPGYLHAASGTPFKVAICLDGRGTADYFTREIVRMLRAFGDHPNYPKVNGRHVIGTYSFLRHKPEMWNELKQRLQTEGFNPYFIANANPWPRKPTEFGQIEPCREAFDAVYFFDAPGHAKDPPETTNRELRDWCAANGKRAIPSLHPGYWGAWLKGHNDYYHPFRGMDMLYRMFASGKAAGPVDWIHVTTWNDLCETALLPCAFTPGITRLVHAYCDGLKGLDIASDDVRVNVAYHREELVGTLWRMEAMSLPRRGGGDVSIRGVLLGTDGKKVADLPPRRFSGRDFERCEWLVPTAAHAKELCLTPCLRIETADGAPPRTAVLPSVHLVTGWIRNAVTVNVALDRLIDNFRPRLAVSQSNDVLTASLAFAAPEPVRTAILFRNDRPFAVLDATQSATGSFQRVVRMDQIDGELTMSVSNGRILRAVKNYERNGCRTWQWDAQGLVTRQNPKWSVHAFVVEGGRDLKLDFASKGSERLDYDGPDLTVMNAAPLDLSRGTVAVRRQAPTPAASDTFWALVETASGRLHYTASIWPFDAARRFVPRAILETATSLETSCDGGGYALRNDSEFLTPAKNRPVRDNRVVNVRVPLAGARHASWDLRNRTGVFELPRRTWPQGTQRIAMRIRPEGPFDRRQTLVFQEGLSDGIQMELTENGRIELSRVYQSGLQTKVDRVVGATPLKPDVWQDILVEGDMAGVRLWIDGRRDAELRPSPGRGFGGCRIFIGGGRNREPFRGAIERLEISGL